MRRIARITHMILTHILRCIDLLGHELYPGRRLAAGPRTGEGRRLCHLVTPRYHQYIIDTHRYGMVRIPHMRRRGTLRAYVIRITHARTSHAQNTRIASSHQYALTRIIAYHRIHAHAHYQRSIGE
jgi:hypothetical protein